MNSSAKFGWDKSQTSPYVPPVLPLVFSIFFAPLFSQSVMKRAPFNNLTLSWHFLSAKTITTFFSLNRGGFCLFQRNKTPGARCRFFVVSVTWYVSCLAFWQLKSVFASFLKLQSFQYSWNIWGVFSSFLWDFLRTLINFQVAATTPKFSYCSSAVRQL